MILFYLAPCQVQKLTPLSHPIRLKTETNCNSSSRVFPRFRQFSFFFFSSLSSYWLMVMFSFILIGCFHKFVFGVAALNRNALHKALQGLAYHRLLLPCATVDTASNRKIGFGSGSNPHGGLLFPRMTKECTIYPHNLKRLF